MSLYGDYREWSNGRSEELEGDPVRRLQFLADQQELRDELLRVCDMLATVTQDPGSLWGKLARYAFLLQDPLKGVRSQIRRIRALWAG
jgi:hypothetical protein